MKITNIKESVKLPGGILLSPQLSDEQRDQMLAHFGLTSVNDALKVETSVGAIVFDIYDALTPRPKAPLALERELTRRQDLAKVLTENAEVDLDLDIEAKLKQALEDDSTWEKIQVSVSYEKEGQRIYDRFSADAVHFFPKCRDALLAAFRVAIVA